MARGPRPYRHAAVAVKGPEVELMPPWFGGRPFDAGPAAAMEKVEIEAAEGDTESKEISENVDVHGEAANEATSDKIVESVTHSEFVKEIAVEYAQRWLTASPKNLQDFQDFKDFLLPLSEKSPGSDGSPGTAEVQSAFGHLGTSNNQMEPAVETLSSHWKRDVRPSTPPKRRPRDLPRSSRKAPVKPGLVTPESCMECLYPKPPKDRHYDEGAEIEKEAIRKQKVEDKDATEVEKDKPKQKVSPRAICEEPHVKDRQDKEYVEVTVEKEATPMWSAATSPTKSGKMTLRITITPQHFFSYGTAFRDVQVDFKPARVIVRAVDMEGYSWSAFAQNFPGPLAVDQLHI